jgi:hypothetical protein
VPIDRYPASLHPVGTLWGVGAMLRVKTLSPFTAIIGAAVTLGCPAVSQSAAPIIQVQATTQAAPKSKNKSGPSTKMPPKFGAPPGSYWEWLKAQEKSTGKQAAPRGVGQSRRKDCPDC